MLLAWLLLVPLLAAALAWALRPLEEVTLTIGTTRFADPAVYEGDAAEFTAEHCKEYFRDGATVVRGALRPEVVAAVLGEFLSRHRPDDYINGLWMESDALRDIFLYSNLGALAAQIYSCDGAETQHEPAAALLYRAHIGGRGSGWHYDTSDCQDGDFPSNFTARSLPRMVVPLAPLDERESVLQGTVLYNQSVYASAMSPEEGELYWRGELPYRLTEDRFDFSNVTALPPAGALPAGHRAAHAGLVEPRLLLGDMMVLSPCSIHRGPMPFRPGLTLALTYAPASAGLNRRYGKGRGDCLHGLSPGETMRGPCFPWAFPREERASKGVQVTLQKVRMSSII